MKSAPPRLEVVFTPGELGETSLKGKGVVVIDVLRSATTIAKALASGAELVVPLASTEDVTRLASTLERKQILLCGERDGVRIEGYALGNSPSEFTAKAVRGKTLLFTTTNGTGAVARSEGAREIVLASLVNLKALVDHLDGKGDWIVLCSGHRGRFALEDALCAGAIVSRLHARRPDLAVNDAGKSAEFLFRSAGDDLPRIVAGTEAGERLKALGLEADVAFSSRIDSIPIVPIVKDGRIAKPAK
ncbi:MAG: 2-phosphosulfolactate phosphatase [Candidatus Eisenbacteria bacterium]|nr:2-phosphosulfolactate phosphatase [Candidatus Eisenbacteria bacterium]